MLKDDPGKQAVRPEPDDFQHIVEGLSGFGYKPGRIVYGEDKQQGYTNGVANGPVLDTHQEGDEGGCKEEVVESAPGRAYHKPQAVHADGGPYDGVAGEYLTEDI